MLGIALDAVVLMFLLKTVNDDDVGFGTAILVALAAAIATPVLGFALGLVLGVAGAYLAVLIAAALLGVAVSALFDVEVKRAFIIGGIFMAVHIGFAVGINSMMRTGSEKAAAPGRVSGARDAGRGDP